MPQTPGVLHYWVNVCIRRAEQRRVYVYLVYNATSTTNSLFLRMSDAFSVRCCVVVQCVSVQSAVSVGDFVILANVTPIGI